QHFVTTTTPSRLPMTLCSGLVQAFGHVRAILPTVLAEIFRLAVYGSTITTPTLPTPHLAGIRCQGLGAKPTDAARGLSANQEPVGVVLRTASRLLLTCTPTKDARGAPEETGAPLALYYLPAGLGILVVFINRHIGLLIHPVNFAHGV